MLAVIETKKPVPRYIIFSLESDGFFIPIKTTHFLTGSGIRIFMSGGGIKYRWGQFAKRVSQKEVVFIC